MERFEVGYSFLILMKEIKRSTALHQFNEKKLFFFCILTDAKKLNKAFAYGLYW